MTFCSKWHLAGLVACAAQSLIWSQSITGKVTDAINGDPVVGAAVTIAELNKTFSTDNEGKFFTDTIAPGTYVVRVELASYLKQSKKVIVASAREIGSANLFLEFPIYHLSSNAEAARSGTSVSYMFPVHDVVEIQIYNTDGVCVRKVLDRTRTGGTRNFSWDGKDNKGMPVPAGKYTCRLSAGNLLMTRVLELTGSAQGK